MKGMGDEVFWINTSFFTLLLLRGDSFIWDLLDLKGLGHLDEFLLLKGEKSSHVELAYWEL
jgi:hypothetical protein